MKKKTTILLMLILFSTLATAQNTFEKLWLQVEKFEVENLPKSALQIVEKIYTTASKEKNSPQIIKSLLYKSKFALTLEEDAQIKIINNFTSEIASSNFPTKNILENILGNLYWQYFKKNRYQFYNRTKLNNAVLSKESDFRTWDVNTLFLEIDKHFTYSFNNSEKLQKINIKDFKNILDIEKYVDTYTPTLFDFLTNNALNFYKTSENSIPEATTNFTINNSAFLSDLKTFKNLKIASKDSLSTQLKALKTYQKLIAFHLKTNNKSALIHIDIERLNFIYKNAIIQNKKTLLLQTLQNSQKTFLHDKASGLYAFEIAKMYRDNNKNAKALAICKTTITEYPNSFAAEKCKVLQRQIEAKKLFIKTEKHIPTHKNSRVLVTYKNVEKLFFTSYKITKKLQEEFNRIHNFKGRVTFIKQLKKIESWQHKLRNTGDYLTHTTEVIVPKFEKGMYLIVASENQNLNKNFIYGTSTIQITNLALVENTFNNQYNYQVVDRVTGKPIENAQIHLQNLEQNNNRQINKKLTTDKNGFASFRNKNYAPNVEIAVKTATDFALFEDFYLKNLRINKSTKADNEITIKPFIFTDRSIYRPGQTVYFKVIAIKNQNDVSTVLKNKHIEVVLRDVNNQIIKTLDLKLNEFGSVAGQFILPNNGLTGAFEIEVDESITNDSKFYDSKNVYFENSYYEFSVEEYKRPKFETKFKPITKSYKLNDSITVNGFAKAFSGANITDAKVVYSVHRKVQYPSWYYWRNPNAYSSAQEITNGESITDDLGNFSIQFKALPDNNVSKESLPILATK